MRKWLKRSGLIVIVALAMTFAITNGKKALVEAQNFVNTYVSYAVNLPGYIMNSISQSYYGQLFSSTNAGGLASWNLGYGQSQTALGSVNSGASNAASSLLSWDVSGWLALKSSYVALGSGSPSLPTTTSCGTNNSGTEGSDQTGDVTVGSSPGQNCSINFANKPANKPLCFCNDVTSPAEGCEVLLTTTSGFSMTPFRPTFGNGTDAFAANDELDWFCSARQ